MSFSTADLVSIARVLSDIERGLRKAERRDSEIDIRLDRVPIHLRGVLAGHAVRGDNGRMEFQPSTERVEPTLVISEETTSDEPESTIEDDPETEVIIVSGGEVDETKPFGGILDPLAERKKD